MAYDPGAIDATLAAAVGDEPALIAELRLAFAESARANLGAMETAASVEEWRKAAGRLKGLAASFGAVRLMAMADEAAVSGFGDRQVVRRLARAVERL